MEEEGNVTLGLERKSEEVIKSSKTLNLARTEGQRTNLLKFPNLVRKRKGTFKLSNASNLGQKRIQIAKFIRKF